MRLLCMGATLSGCLQVEEESFVVDGPLVGMVVEMSSGEVEVAPGPEGQATVDLEFGGLGYDGFDREVVDGVLWLDLRCRGACVGDLSVSLPPGAWADVRLSSGDVSVEDLDASVRVQVGAGAIEAWNLSGDAVDLATGAGSIDAVLEPEVRSVTANASAGEAALVVDGGAWRLSTDAGSGHIAVDGVHHDAASERVLVADAGAGSVDIVGE
jgi:hypothetical protein